jgi:hypothetical protein
MAMAVLTEDRLIQTAGLAGITLEAIGAHLVGEYRALNIRQGGRLWITSG